MSGNGGVLWSISLSHREDHLPYLCCDITWVMKTSRTAWLNVQSWLFNSITFAPRMALSPRGLQAHPASSVFSTQRWNCPGKEEPGGKPQCHLRWSTRSKLADISMSSEPPLIHSRGHHRGPPVHSGERLFLGITMVCHLITYRKCIRINSLK